MAQLSHKVELYLGRRIDFLKDVILHDDGDGGYIKEWNVDEARPTDEQLNALESQAVTVENNLKIIRARKLEYPSLEELIVALYDTEDKVAIEKRRADIKLKYPKE